MQLNKLKKYALVLIAGIIVGFSVGLFVGNNQAIKFDTTIDISTLISATSLFTAITIVPFIIERKMADINNVNDCATRDLETLSGKISDIIEIYTSLGQDSVVNEQIYKTILSSFKDISSLSYSLADIFKEFGALDDFKERIIADAFMPAYETCTEHLKKDRSMSEQQLESSIASLRTLRNVVNQYRYSLFKG